MRRCFHRHPAVSATTLLRRYDPGMSRLARDVWRLVEPYYQLASRSPEVDGAYGEVGLVRADQQYFGGRLAPLGPVSAKVAVAVLYGFDPEYVGRAVPELWAVATPAQVSAARLAGAAAMSRRVLGDDHDGSSVREAAGLARAFVDVMDFAGRPLAAAHAGLPRSDESGSALWQACTILREHRGDAHWAATSAEGLDAVECHILHAADGAMPADLLQRVSGWDDEAWVAGTERLMSCGLVATDDEGPSLTDAGRAAKLRVETSTDRGALQPLTAAGLDRVERFRTLMQPLVDRIMASGVIGHWKTREERWKDLPEPQ